MACKRTLTELQHINVTLFNEHAHETIQLPASTVHINYYLFIHLNCLQWKLQSIASYKIHSASITTIRYQGEALTKPRISKK